jgi:hypothetical protein
VHQDHGERDRGELGEVVDLVREQHRRHDRARPGQQRGTQGHDASRRARLRAIAGNLGLIVTGSSDHHGTGKVDHDLGCNTTDPAEYARIVELAAKARAGR